MAIEVITKFKVYKLNYVADNKKYQALEEVVFGGIVSNYFDTEEEAIQAIVYDNKIYREFVILKSVF